MLQVQTRMLLSDLMMAKEWLQLREAMVRSGRREMRRSFCLDLLGAISLCGH